MRRLAAATVALAVACTSGTDPGPSSPTPTFPSVEVRTGPTTARQAMRRLCVAPDVRANPVNEVATPAAILEVESQVESVRGLMFRRPVNIEAISPAEIDRRIGRYLDTYYPKRFYARRSETWTTIGAIPGEVGILEALDRYQQGQVLGFYNSQNEELVYTGDADLDRIEQFVLAHELTHAIDDQHFDLDRIDELASRCDDERFQAALGVVEGSANHFATQVILRFPVTEIGDISGGPTAGVPDLIVQLQLYPYTNGQAFVDALADVGGTAAVDRALRNLPATTEQVLHPERFPDDLPKEVDVPDFGPTFGRDWRDHDVMIVGELWLRLLLGLRLDRTRAERAADGWDGGTYRAWSDGEDVAVVLSTVWDTPEEAAQFQEALRRWIERGERHGVVLEADGASVHAGFASRAELMGAVFSAIRSL
jgi:hypothetical protein